MVLPREDFHDRSIDTNDGVKYLCMQTVIASESSIPVSMSLMKPPKVGRLSAVVRASAMLFLVHRGFRGLGECKFRSADKILLWKPVVCVLQVLGIRVVVSFICPLYVGSSNACIPWCHRLLSLS